MWQQCSGRGAEEKIGINKAGSCCLVCGVCRRIAGSWSREVMGELSISLPKGFKGRQMQH